MSSIFSRVAQNITQTLLKKRLFEETKIEARKILRARKKGRPDFAQDLAKVTLYVIYARIRCVSSVMAASWFSSLLEIRLMPSTAVFALVDATIDVVFLTHKI